MTPAERVAFILHDVFGYPFADIAEITGRSPAACRQFASSARRRIRASQAPAAPAAHQASIVRAFKQAWQAKDIDALIRLLDPVATVIGDGGGLVRAVLCPVEGGGQIARFFIDLAGRIPSNVRTWSAFIEGWAERAKIMTTQQGFRDTLVHRALSPEGRFQLVNVSHWDSAESTAAAHADPQWQASRASLAQRAPRAVANQQLYRVVAGYITPPDADEPSTGPAVY
jgi:heme-degrading monooxygenase HmoA